MIKAIYRDGVIQPVDPVPLDWPEGQELQIQRLQASSADVELRRQFESLSGQWKQESRYLSSTTDISTNPAYQRIIGMGMPVVPLILEDLRKQPYHWFSPSAILSVRHFNKSTVMQTRGQLVTTRIGRWASSPFPSWRSLYGSDVVFRHVSREMEKRQ